jgi:hypothetical protein
VGDELALGAELTTGVLPVIADGADPPPEQEASTMTPALTATANTGRRRAARTRGACPPILNGPSGGRHTVPRCEPAR